MAIIEKQNDVQVKRIRIRNHVHEARQTCHAEARNIYRRQPLGIALDLGSQEMSSLLAPSQALGPS